MINTGIRVYSITLKKPISKHLTMGGFNIRTKYTGQDKHIQQDRDEKNQLRRQRQDEQNKRGEEEETQYEREYMAEFPTNTKTTETATTATTATTTTARRTTTDTDRRTIYGKTGRHGNTDDAGTRTIKRRTMDRRNTKTKKS